MDGVVLGLETDKHAGQQGCQLVSNVLAPCAGQIGRNVSDLSGSVHAVHIAKTRVGHGSWVGVKGNLHAADT